MPTPVDSLRPQYHFAPLRGWMNDPNGMIFYDDEFHLFYQHYPTDLIWGPMHWGHAISKDLVNWTHLPVALYPDEHGYIYSGSAIIDRQNTAGFGAGAMVALFTHYNPENAEQSQSLAYSLDKGRTWTKYSDNPIIAAPNNMRDFRDPKVFWYEGRDGVGHWVMLLAAGQAILFYSSTNLTEWKNVGSFGNGYGSTAGVWETPELFQLPVDGGEDSRWVLTAGVGDGAPAGGSGTQYWVGQFDGQVFRSDNPQETFLWADWGGDFYAAQSWNDSERSESGCRRRLWLAWFNNWRYAQVIPAVECRGAMSLPREVGLTQTKDGIRLVQAPVVELQRLRTEHYSWSTVTVGPTCSFRPNLQDELLELVVDFRLDPAVNAQRLGIRIRTGNEEATIVGYLPQSHTLFIDRSHSGVVDFNQDFPSLHAAHMPPVGEVIRLHIFLDRTSIELFGNDGLVVMSDLIFPTQRPYHLEFFAEKGDVVINTLDVYPLQAAESLIESEG